MSDWFAQHLAPSPEALDSAVGGETVILHLGNDTYFGLDETGTRIWSMLKAGVALPEIRDQLAADYEVEPTQVEADIKHFVEDLLKNGILVHA